MIPSRAHRAIRVGMVLTLVGMAAACAGGGPPSVAPSAPPALATDPGVDGPPAALAAVEGGDPVAGQLGTYTWGATGSDSPWLPGAPIRVGTGETLTIVLEPSVGVASWTARSVPSRQAGPDGATTLGQGPPPMRFAAPAAGTWTVEVSVVFADERGTASYAWAVTVR